MKKIIASIFVLTLGTLSIVFFKSTAPEKKPIVKSKKIRMKKMVTFLKENPDRNKSVGPSSVISPENFMASMKQVYIESKEKEFKDMSRVELMGHLVSLFDQKKNMQQMNFEKVEEVADKIIEADDTVYAAYKAKLMSQLMPFIMKKKSAGGLFKTLDIMDKFDIEDHDPELYDIRALAILNSQKPQMLLSYGERMLEEKPKSGLGHYFRAMYYHSSKSNLKVKESLEEALKYEPHNSKYKSALKALSEGKGKVFSLSISFDPHKF